MDIKSYEARSHNMSAIKSRNTKPEVKVRKALFNLGFRYKVDNNLIGKPDMVFSRKKIVVFIDGCFWHGCPTCYKKPENNNMFWEKKLINNKTRDSFVNSQLSSTGWTVLRVWEHNIKKNFDEVIHELTQVIVDNGHISIENIKYLAILIPNG